MTYNICSGYASSVDIHLELLAPDLPLFSSPSLSFSLSHTLASLAHFKLWLSGLVGEILAVSPNLWHKPSQGPSEHYVCRLNYIEEDTDVRHVLYLSCRFLT